MPVNSWKVMRSAMKIGTVKNYLLEGEKIEDRERN